MAIRDYQAGQSLGISAGYANAAGTTSIGAAGHSYYGNNDIRFDGSINLPGAKADIKIGDKSLATWMETVEKRLCILEPKPELLAKYEALQQAYDHYKTLESMLYDDK